MEIYLLKRTVILLSILFGIFIPIHAQKASITAHVIDRENKPIEYANVQLMDKDSIFIKGTVTDMDGNMEIKVDRADDYWLNITNIGYETNSTFIPKASGKLPLGDIILKESTIALDSVTVTAHRIIHQIDRQIILPNQLERKSSNTAFDLIGNMGLSRLKVDKTNKSISLMDGGNIQIRINGVPASIKEIYAIPNKEIIRVEYYDNPGAQVKEDAIIDFIVRRKQNGGYISTDLSNAVNIAFGNNNILLKLNHKNSEFTVNYYTENRHFKKAWYESTTTFNYPNGQQMIREEKGIPASTYYWYNYVQASYNYTLTDKRVFNINLINGSITGETKTNSLSTYSTQPDNTFLISKRNKDPFLNPAINLYYNEKLPKKQEIIFEVAGEYKRSKYHRNYSETNITTTDKDTITSNIKGDLYSFYAAGNYKKKFEKLLFLSGVTYNWSHSQNKYSGTIAEQSTLRNQELYFYTQIQGEIGKLSYMGNLGVSYFDFNDKNNTYRYWQFKPNISASYAPTKDINIQYQLSFQNFAPSISEMSNVIQMIDPYQIKKGNPKLKYCSLYANTLSASYQRKRFNANVIFYNRYIKNPIWEDIYFDEQESKFISASNNHKSNMGTGIVTKINWQILKDILSISLYGEICWMKVDSELFHYKIAPFLGGGELNFSMKGWQVRFEMYNRIRRLQGTSITYDEWPTDILDVGYKYKELYIGFRSFGLFANNTYQGEKNLTPIRPSTSWSYTDSTPTISLRLSWNFAWGKKSKAEQIEVKRAGSETGILKVN